MSSEARGIMRALAQTFVAADAHGGQDIRRALLLGEHDLTGELQRDTALVNRLANYITYIVFSKNLRLTATQSLLVSQLLAIGRRSSDGDGLIDPTQF